MARLDAALEFAKSGMDLILPITSEMVIHAREESPDFGGLPNAEAILHVEQLQPDLVGVTLRITWDDPDNPGEQITNEVLVPIHRDGYPEGGGE